ncbi:la-related protein 6-like [Liolophura sinensis]|uniref:la-related protein 6-like n=1 Tax=Liolophura sinensis TaxID=3198878 RepID=UPI003159920E
MSEVEDRVAVTEAADGIQTLTMTVTESQSQQSDSPSNVSNNSLFDPNGVAQSNPRQLVDLVDVGICDSKTRVVGPAPTLRVEKLRDEDSVSLNSLAYTSEEEGGSHDVSDMDADHSDRGDGNKPPLADFVPPDDELKNKIISQVEFYFSDANILKDAFLLKHVRRNKQGYVSIKLITSFKKVKSLTKDYRVVAYSLSASEKLEVNEEETKVRRKDPLPEFDETTPSRSVVVVNIPINPPTIEGIAEMFSKCGEVALIRIIRPGKSIPQDVKKYSSKHPEIGTTICAVVEFEKHESAKKACELMTNSDDWRKGMRVVLLAVNKKKDKDGGKKVDVINVGGAGDQQGDIHIEKDPEGEHGDQTKDPEKKRRKRGARKKKNRVDELTNETESCYSSGSEAEQASKPQSSSLQVNQSGLDPNRLSPHGTPRSSPRSSPMSSPRSRRRGGYGKSPLLESPNGSPRPSPRSSPEMGRKRVDYSSGGDSSPSSPWVQRRIKAAQERSPLAQNGSPRGSPLPGRRNMSNMMGVVRQPLGPDGSKGFYGGKGRGLPLSTSA